MDMEKIYIAGCGGMLGDAFYKDFKNDYKLKCTDKNITDDWIDLLDFRDYDEYRKDVVDFDPDILIHMGAYTDLEFCENNIEDTYLTNTISVEYAVKIANELGIKLLYISTAGIFDGEKPTYDDWDLPDPLNHYGRSKYAGEMYVKENSDNYLICRAGWMMGAGPGKDKKFIQKMMMQIKENKKHLYVVNDKDGTPTYTHDFAKNVKLLIEKGEEGLFNLVCEGLTSRLEVAKELIEILGLENEIVLEEVPSDYFKQEYFADRPPSERLVNRRLNCKKLNIMRDWKTALKEYVNNYYRDYL